MGRWQRQNAHDHGNSGLSLRAAVALIVTKVDQLIEATSRRADPVL